jgi:hypothetical protein
MKIFAKIHNLQTMKLGLAAILIVISLTASAPFFFAQKANAVSVVVPTAPTLLSPTPAGADLNTGTFQLSWTYSNDGSGPGIAYYQYQAAMTPDVDQNGELENVIASRSPLTDPFVQASGTPDGTYYWQVRAVDNAGTDSAWSTVGEVTVDTSKPDAPILTTPGLTNVTPVSVSWTGPSDAVSYSLQLSTDSTFTDPTQITTHNYSATELSDSFGGLLDGTYYIRISDQDAAGNVSDYAVGSFTLDTTPPTTEITSPMSGATFGGNAQVEIDGTSGDSTSYTLSIGNTGQTPLATTSGTTFSSYVWDTTGVASGTYIATLTTFDAAGNSAVSEVDITIDNTAPVLTVDTQTNTTTTQPTITGTVDDVDATLTASFNGVSGYVVTNNNGNYSFMAPAVLGNGTYSFTITATDAYGNVANQTADVLVAVPVAAVTTPTTPTTTDEVTPIITNPGDAAVLGATTTNTSPAVAGDSGVKGATDDKTAAAAINSEANKGTIFGIAWYWWILILAALALIAWYISGMVRRRDENRI